MFQFPPFASACLCIQQRITGYDPAGFPAFGDPRIKACLQLPELIAAATSFFGSWRQGIHHIPLVA